ncbi:MAG: biotin/lipoyl-binding protein, partial [Candidatus Omnitrophica bacterium]|nr:biotin/lipoyl-binding protein [Candidatus Omnitrophota bacterium]
MKKRIKLLLIILILIAASLGALFFLAKDKHNGKVIKVSGNIEGNDVRISFRVAGQIEQLLSDEGIYLKKGDIVARLNKDELSKIKA